MVELAASASSSQSNAPAPAAISPRQVTAAVVGNALALGRAPQVEKPGWAEAFRERKRRAKMQK